MTTKEHELELSQLDQHEEQENKKNISLKAKIEKYDSSEDENDKEETDDMSLFVKKFNKFLIRNKGARTGQMKKFSKSNEASTSNKNFKCFECGKPDYMKMECPNIKKSSFKGKNEIKNGRRAYIAWEDNDTTRVGSLERERLNWKGEILGYTGGFSPERGLARLGEKSGVLDLSKL
ncbi:hypothetical protein Lal_00035212 [Lupinus albus]|nr:hypothetical protein Lal_00035212 [Lupinus albus]